MNLIQVTAENRDSVKAYYLSLCDQGRANFLYDNMIGGGTLRLNPEQYPKTKPLHRICVCGSKPELIGSMHLSHGDMYVRCPNCGCRAREEGVPHMAWRNWDMNILKEDENLTIWDLE